MKPKPLIIASEDRQSALNVIGTQVTVLASSVDTHGQEFTFQSGEEGMGPPPHSHDWDESFYVLKGSIEFICSGENYMCNPGTLVYIPGGTVHAFSYGPNGGEMLEITSKGSIATQMFTALSKEIPPGTPDIHKVIEVFKQNGVTTHI